MASKWTPRTKEIDLWLAQVRMTRRELAEVMGVTPSWLSQVLNGKQPASADFVAAFTTKAAPGHPWHDFFKEGEQ